MRTRASWMQVLVASLCMLPALSLAQEASPHAEAIALVMTVRADEIRKLDSRGEMWWHDTLERSWAAKRPFAPGLIDSTHTFVVTYSIDGAVVGKWNVDTRTHTVAGASDAIRLK